MYSQLLGIIYNLLCTIASSTSTDDRAAIVLNEIDAAETTAPPEDPAVTQESTERVKQFIERYFPNSYLLEERPVSLI